MWNYYLSARALRRALAPALRALRRARADAPRLRGRARRRARGRPHRRRGRATAATNPITWPGEIDNFFQPHYQLVHDARPRRRRRSSRRRSTLFQGDGYYDQFRADARSPSTTCPTSRCPTAPSITETRPRPPPQRGRVGRGWVPTLVARRGPLDRSSCRARRASTAPITSARCTWAQFYPRRRARPTSRYYDYARRTRTRPRRRRRVRLDGDAAADAVRRARSTRTTATECRDDQLKGVAFTERYDFVLPRAGAVFTLATDADAYANVARGMREPFFRSIYDPQDYYARRASARPRGRVERRGRDLRAARAPGACAPTSSSWTSATRSSTPAPSTTTACPSTATARARATTASRSTARWTPEPTLRRSTATLSLSRNTFTEYREYNWDGGVVSLRRQPHRRLPRRDGSG